MSSKSGLIDHYRRCILLLIRHFRKMINNCLTSQRKNNSLLLIDFIKFLDLSCWDELRKKSKKSFLQRVKWLSKSSCQIGRKLSTMVLQKVFWQEIQQQEKLEIKVWGTQWCSCAKFVIILINSSTTIRKISIGFIWYLENLSFLIVYCPKCFKMIRKVKVIKF